MLNNDKFDSLQQEIVDDLLNVVLNKKDKFNSCVKQLLAFDKPDVCLAVGQTFGSLLYDFCLQVDEEHPGLADVFDGLLAEDGDFILSLEKIILTCMYTKSKNFNDLIPVICKYFSSKSYKDWFEQNPFRYCHLLKDANDRETARARRQSRSITIHAVDKKIGTIWDKIPNDFALYSRFGKIYEEEMAKAQKIADRYKSLGCQSLYREIEDSMDDFRKKLGENYYGFKKITMNRAAAILAKQCDFSYENSRIVPSQEVSQSVSTSKCNYLPYVIPIKLLTCYMPARVSRIIDNLEVYEPIGGKCLFDDYFVMIPTLIPEELIGSQNDILMRDFSLKLIQSGKVIPVVIGELNGDCYFISYWM